MVLLLSSLMLDVSAEGLSVSAGAYVLYCVDSGQVILGRNENVPQGMASTTKIMTSLLALEHAATCDEVVEFTRDMIAEGSSMYLKIGDKVSLSDLAVGMMTVSGNDAANAAAIAMGGSKENFAKLMNSRAKQIGMKNTNFVTPSGLSDPEHYSTAYDMALLMAEAMENREFAELTKKKSAQVDFIYPVGQQVTYSNHNRLLSLYEYCIGGKTGYTKSTGRCLVTCAERDGLRLIAVTLNDRNDWNDHVALYKYGFENFSALSFYGQEESFSVPVAGSDVSHITAKLSESTKYVVDRADADRAVYTVYLPPVIFAPVKEGDVIGKAVCTLDGKVVLESELIAESSAMNKEKFTLLRFMENLFR